MENIALQRSSVPKDTPDLPCDDNTSLGKIAGEIETEQIISHQENSESQRVIQE